MQNNDFHPDLRMAARFVPRGMASSRIGLRIVRASSALPSRGTRARTAEVVGLPSGASMRVHRPDGSNATGAALLWMHGGGYVMGHARQDDVTCRRFADRLGLLVAAVDYRLAPEHPHPTPLEDCHEGLGWLMASPEVDSARVAVGGASAGGGLAAALALLARDRGDYSLAHQLLVYPMIDDRSSQRVDAARGRFRLWNPRNNEFAWRCYVGGADPGRVAPSRRDDLAGLPATWIGVGERDMFHDEDVDYARRLRNAGVDCALEIVPGAFHGFDAIVPGAPVTRAFFESQCEALRAALG